MKKMYLKLAAQASQPAKKDGRSNLCFLKMCQSVIFGFGSLILIWKFDLDFGEKGHL